MKMMRRVFSRYHLPLFFLFAYLLSWWAVPFSDGQLIPHGPTLAAITVLAFSAGGHGLQSWWRYSSGWRTSWYWYVIGPGIVLGYQGLALMINLLLGAHVSQFPSLPAMGTILELLLLGGLWEEPGWTGYALPKLQERFANRRNGAVSAVLLLGVFRTAWHLPLFIYGHIPWFDIVVFEIAFQVIIGWLYNRSGGNVLVVMLFHLMSNIAGAVMFPVFTLSARTNYYILFTILASLVAIVALVKYPRPVNISLPK